MPITKSQFEGTWRLADFISVGVERGQEGAGPEQFAGFGLLVGREPISVRAAIPRKVYRKALRLLAPYITGEAERAFPGTSADAEVGQPDPGDRD